MAIFLSIVIVLLGAAGIFGLRAVTRKIKVVLHPDKAVDFQIKFQLVQLILAGAVLLLIGLLNQANMGIFLRVGNPAAHSSPVGWLGIAGTETWLEIASTLGCMITLATGVFMFLQLRKAKVETNTALVCLLWALPFSAANAFSEEAIFRVGVVAPLYGILPAATICLVSAAIFGVPHYFGQPGGLIGVVMAGFLGWLLALSLLDTQGLLVAWSIHFVQDVVIITSILLMSGPANLKGQK